MVKSDWFRDSGIRELVVSRSVEEIQEGAFAQCRNLDKVIFVECAKLPVISSKAFSDTPVPEIVLPSTLRSIDNNALAGFDHLKVIWVEDGFPTDILTTLNDFAGVLLLSTRVGGELLCDLRKQQDIVIPDGVERIERFWFCGCRANSVIIPASVKEIEEYAF